MFKLLVEFLQILQDRHLLSPCIIVVYHPSQMTFLQFFVLDKLKMFQCLEVYGYIQTLYFLHQFVKSINHTHTHFYMLYLIEIIPKTIIL